MIPSYYKEKKRKKSMVKSMAFFDLLFGKKKQVEKSAIVQAALNKFPYPSPLVDYCDYLCLNCMEQYRQRAGKPDTHHSQYCNKKYAKSTKQMLLRRALFE